MFSRISMYEMTRGGWYSIIHRAPNLDPIEFTSRTADEAWTRLTYVVMRLELIDFPPWQGCTPSDHELDGPDE